MLIDITIPGKPVAKGRPRFGVVNGRARAWTPRATQAWEKLAAGVCRAVYQGKPIDFPVSVSVTAVHPRPKNLMRKKDHRGRLWRAKKPDVDNEAKAALDALVKGGILEDDALVVELLARSMMTAIGEEAHVRIVITTVDEHPM